VSIPKPDGGERPLGIPTIRDRVVQTAAKLVLEPIFEADFEDNAYGYRPVRGAVDAVREVHRLICRGHTDVVDADLIPLLRFDSAWRASEINSSSHRGNFSRVSGNRNERINLSVIQPAAYSGVFRRIGIETTLKFPDRRIARAADGIKRDAPGTPLVRLSTAGNESWGPVAGKDWMLQRIVYCCRGLSGTVCPIGGRDDGRAA
jgi:hypothetical protein